MNTWSDPARSSKIKVSNFYTKFAEYHPDLKTTILGIKLDEAKDALSYLNLPGAEPLQQRPVVLGFGPVQSGKTLSMQCVLALAVDNGFRLFIVTSTNILSLLMQTFDRFQEDFGLAKEPLWGKNHIRTHIVDLESSNDKKKQVAAIAESLENYCVIVFVNKNVRLNTLKEIIGNLMDPHRLTNKPLDSAQILMFDDESDVGTVDGVQASDTEQLTYSLMKELREEAPNSSVFLSTASPWANFFAKKDDEFEIDHVTLFTPGEEYCGLTSFLPNHANPGDEGLVLCREIPATNDWSTNSPPVSLRESLAFFIIGCLHTMNEHEIEGCPDSFPRRCMFVNPGRTKDEHTKAELALKRIIEAWSNSGRSGDFGFLKTKAYPIYKSRMAQSKMAYFTIDELTKHWDNFFHNLKGPVIINNTNPDKDISKYQIQNRFQIFVGHKILSRGITLKGLTVSYYSNNPSTQADTLYQSARFLGYRQKYKNLCGVFLAKPMLDAFEDYRLIEDFFIEAAKKYNTRPPKDKSWVVFVDELVEELSAKITEGNNNRILTALNKQHRFGLRKVTIKGWFHIWIEFTEDVDFLLRQLMSSIKDCSLSVEEVSTMGLNKDALAILSESRSGTYASLLNSKKLCEYLKKFKEHTPNFKFWGDEKKRQFTYLIDLIGDHEQKNALIFPIKSEFSDNTSLKTQIRNKPSVQQNPEGKAEKNLHGQKGENGIVSMQLHKFQPDSEQLARLSGLDINKKYLVLSILFPVDKTTRIRVD